MLITLFKDRVRKEGLRSAVASAFRYAWNAGSRGFRQAFLASYSQYGEDLVIDRLLGRPRSGTFVDVGANHPSRLSNTKRFYDRGWSGVNIEPNFENFSLFLAARPRDINLNIGIGTEPGTLNFYRFDPHEVSTFSRQAAENYQALGYRLIEERSVEVKTLAHVLAAELGGRKVDFMSIDTEGFDLQVLESNDWDATRPRLICIESADHETRVENADIAAYLRKVGYERAHFNGVNGVWRDVRP